MATAFSVRFLKLVGAAVKALGRAFPRLNAALWDVQYRLGLWDDLDCGHATGRELAEMVEACAPQGSILDLGCGSTANLPLTPGAYRRYHGVDISAHAIERARLVGRPNATYETADILSYRPQETYDAILLREVIYYLPLAKVSGFLSRLSGFLAPGGVILIQVWSGELHPGLVAAIEASALPVTLEKTLEQEPGHPSDPGHPTVYLLGKPHSEALAPAGFIREFLTAVVRES